jgi:hypothetical protein
VEGCVLTEGLTDKDRSGTLIDWNLCFNAKGESSNRAFRSGTPAFMAPVLLKDKQIPRRTLSHDMESFFAVIIWIATYNYDNEAAFQVKPLADILLDQDTAPKHIVNAKENWFTNTMSFREQIIDHFEVPYHQDAEFRRCLDKLRRILYTVHVEDDLGLDGKNDNEEVGDDSMKVDLFRRCMKEIDNYLHDTKGCDEMELIDPKLADPKSTDPNAPAQLTPESQLFEDFPPAGRTTWARSEWRVREEHEGEAPGQ